MEGEGERGGREGRERGEGERGGREGRERGEGESGGREKGEQRNIQSRVICRILRALRTSSCLSLPCIVFGASVLKYVTRAYKKG